MTSPQPLRHESGDLSVGADVDTEGRVATAVPLTRREARLLAGGALTGVVTLPAAESTTAPIVTAQTVTAPIVVVEGQPLTRRELRARERASAVAPMASAELAAALVVAALVDESAPTLAAASTTPAVSPTAVAPAPAPATAAARPRLAAPAAAPSASATTPRSATPASATPPIASAATTRASASRRRVVTRPSAARTSAGASAGAPKAGRTASRFPSARSRRIGVFGAMLFVGATVVSTSVPANAYFVDTPQNAAVKLAAAAETGRSVGGTSDDQSSQRFVASGAVSAEAVDRDGYSVTQIVQPAQASGGTFSNVAGAAVRWPFDSSPISSGFGARHVTNCNFCSTFHQGLDFTPGAGTPIQIIAAGTVSKVVQGNSALGYNVWIDHVIDGQKVTSVYAHMIAGSIKVTEGQTVAAGQIVGNVGSTGNSTGAHLHFEIHLSGVPVNPLPWLEAHAGH